MTRTRTFDLLRIALAMDNSCFLLDNESVDKYQKLTIMHH